MKANFLCLFSILTTFNAIAEPPASTALDRATVTIPYAELRALWDAAHTKQVEAPPAPPVNSVVHSAELQLRLGESASTLEAAFDVESLDARWQTVRLIDGDVRLDKADANEQAIVWQDGYAVLTNRAGRSRVALQFAAGGIKALTEPRALKFRLDGATVKRLHVAGVPAGVEVRVNDQPATALKNGEATFALRGAAGEIAVQLTAPRPEPPPLRPSKWQVQSQILARSADGRLRFQARVFGRADDGSGIELALALPANAASITATGDDLAESQSERAADGRRLVRARWKTPDVLDRELTLSWSVPQSPLAEQWTLQAPTMAEGADTVGSPGTELEFAL